MEIISHQDLQKFIIQALEDKKAEDVAVIDIEHKASFAKYMICATGRSSKHIASLAEFISLELKHHSHFKTVIEGLNTSWVVLDLGDIIVHLFQKEARENCKIEDLWRKNDELKNK